MCEHVYYPVLIVIIKKQAQTKRRTIYVRIALTYRVFVLVEERTRRHDARDARFKSSRSRRPVHRRVTRPGNGVVHLFVSTPEIHTSLSHFAHGRYR